MSTRLHKKKLKLATVAKMFNALQQAVRDAIVLTPHSKRHILSHAKECVKAMRTQPGIKARPYPVTRLNELVMI